MEDIEKIVLIDDFKIGHSVIDHQHKVIIDEINGFIEEANSDVDASFAKFLLDELRKEYLHHYAYEEKLLSKLEDIDALEHKAKHKDALDYLDSIIESIENKELTEFRDIATLLKTKVEHHIMEDVELKNKFIETVHF